MTDGEIAALTDAMMPGPHGTVGLGELSRRLKQAHPEVPEQQRPHIMREYFEKLWAKRKSK